MPRGSDRATLFSCPVTLRAYPASTESQGLGTLREAVFSPREAELTEG